MFNTHTCKMLTKDRIVETNFNVSHPARLICHTRTYSHHVAIAHLNMLAKFVQMDAVFMISEFRWFKQKLEMRFFECAIFKFDWIDQEILVCCAFPIYKANHLPKMSSHFVFCTSLSTKLIITFGIVPKLYWYSWDLVVVLIFNVEIVTPKLLPLDWQMKAYPKIYPASVFWAEKWDGKWS